MKQLHPLLIVISTFFFISCANVDKLIETGDYDAALNKSVRKLAGKENKKTKYVQAAEEAFAKVTNRDMDRIEQLRKRDNIRDWEKIYQIAQSMKLRQDKIQPLLPLLDKEGYHATFSFVRTEQILMETTAILHDRYYDLAMDALVEARGHNKAAAQTAYDYFDKILRFNPDDNRILSLQSEAEELGITHVVVEMENNSHTFVPFRIEDELLSFNYSGRQSQWMKFHFKESDAPHVDYLAKISVDQLNVSPESLRETVHHFYRTVNEKHIARDEDGNVLRDTSGNKIEVVIPVDVRAQVVEIFQSKEAYIDLTLTIFTADGQLIQKETMQAVSRFDNEACTIDGDRRAVEGRWLNLGRPLPFPTDDSLLLTAADQLKSQVRDYLIEYPFVRA